MDANERDNFLGWLLNGYVGSSSKAMGAHLFGPKIHDAWERRAHPSDPADFNRCLLLLDWMPGARDRLSECREISPKWAALVDRWDEVERCFLDETGPDWTESRSAPLTYALMKEIGL